MGFDKLALWDLIIDLIFFLQPLELTFVLLPLNILCNMCPSRKYSRVEPYYFSLTWYTYMCLPFGRFLAKFGIAMRVFIRDEGAQIT